MSPANLKRYLKQTKSTVLQETSIFEFETPWKSVVTLIVERIMQAGEQV
jgi:hypothetical protein